MAQLLERLKYTKDQWVKVSEPNGSFFLPIPDGFHYSDDPATLDQKNRLVIVPDYFDLREKPMDARFSFIVLKPIIPFEQEFNPQLMDAYEAYLRRLIPVYQDGLMHHFFPEKGCGVLCQAVYGDDELDQNILFGVILVGEIGYYFQVTYTHRWERNANDPEAAERFYQVASDWVKRIYVRKKPAFPKPGKRQNCKFNEQISLLLPSEYVVTGNENTDLDKVIQVEIDPYKDDDGEIQYRYSYMVGLRGPDVGEAGDPPGGGSWLEALVAQMQPTKTWHLLEKPQTWLFSRDLSVLRNDEFVKAFFLSALVQAGPGRALQICGLQTCGDDPDEEKEPFRHLHEILQAIRINGKGLNLNIWTKDIREKLEIAFSKEQPGGTLDDLDDLSDMISEMMHGMSPDERLLESPPEEDEPETDEENQAEIVARAGDLYRIGDQAELLVPDGFVVRRKKDEDGNDTIDAAYDPYQEEGETRYSFICDLKYEKTEDHRITEAGLNADWLQLCEDSHSQDIIVPLLKQPKTKLISWSKTFLFFGVELQVASVQIAIQIERWCGLRLYTLDDRMDAEKRSREFALLYTLLKGVRICGAPLSLDAISPQGMQNVIDALRKEKAKGKENTLDVTPDRDTVETIVKDKLHEMFPDLDFDEDGGEDFPAAMPDEALYPHYANKAARWDIPGVQVVVNPRGTDYQFFPLRNILGNGDDEDEDEDEREERIEIQEHVRRILAKDVEKYDMEKQAQSMRALFHVSPDIFSEEHDRECEIAEGYLHHAYMMSALRSFAWTLAAYCEENKTSPERVEEETLARMVDFIADQEWLNYDGTSYCRGLCGGSDLHVYFLPDGAAEADRQAFLPSEDDRNRVREMKERFPAYNELLPTVGSLTALRKDLAYIYPAIRCLHDRLAKERNEMEPLTGNAADIVYTWCALAAAAKEPFFSEDGPIRCFFTQLPGKKDSGKALPAQKEALSSVKAMPAERAGASAAQKSEDTVPDYEAYLSPAADISFLYKYFVFTGMPSAKDEQNHIVVQKVQKKGGFYRTSISGITDYLVIGPRQPAPSKVRAAIEQIKKGRELKIVRLQDVERALDKPASGQPAEALTIEAPQPIENGEETVVETTESPHIQTEKWNDRICMTEYTSNETVVKVPEGVEIIGPGAFRKCPNLKKVLFPTTLYSINSSDFEGSTLEEVELPAYIHLLIIDVFEDWENMRHVYIPADISDIYYEGYEEDANSIKNFVIHTPTGSAADIFARKYHVPVDNTILAPQNSAANTEERQPRLSALEQKASLPQTVPSKKEGCYIATAVYGAYNAPEVLVLRRFRDEKMQKTLWGRIFIRLYYRFSPSAAERLKKAKHINAIVKCLLDRWVRWLERHW